MHCGDLSGRPAWKNIWKPALCRVSLAVNLMELRSSVCQAVGKRLFTEHPVWKEYILYSLSQFPERHDLGSSCQTRISSEAWHDWVIIEKLFFFFTIFRSLSQCRPVSPNMGFRFTMTQEAEEYLILKYPWKGFQKIISPILFLPVKRLLERKAEHLPHFPFGNALKLMPCFYYFTEILRDCLGKGATFRSRIV